MTLQLAGKPTIVTGGRRGIGKASARALPPEGAAVALLARDARALHAAATGLMAATVRDGGGRHARRHPGRARAAAEAASEIGGAGR